MSANGEVEVDLKRYNRTWSPAEQLKPHFSFSYSVQYMFEERGSEDCVFFSPSRCIKYAVGSDRGQYRQDQRQQLFL